MSDLPVPHPTALSEPFWEAARQGRLVVPQCQDCGLYMWPPISMVCSRTQSDNVEWAEVSGEGTVYSYSVVTRPPTPAFETPYVVAIVELSEGPRMLSSLVDVAPQDVSIGMAVEVRFRQRGPFALYCFAPLRAGSDQADALHPDTGADSEVSKLAG